MCYSTHKDPLQLGSIFLYYSIAAKHMSRRLGFNLFNFPCTIIVNN